jgi:ketol-acid reductoisomerase
MKVAVIGYGSQGKALALNLRDSGHEVVVGLRPRSSSRPQVRAEESLGVDNIPGAVKQAGVICFAFPDHLHKSVYQRSIQPYLQNRPTLWFLHGTSVHFGFIEPPAKSDVILVAPHAPGNAVREQYLGERKLSGFYAIERNKSRHARQTAFELAQGIGIQRKNLLKTSFEQESVGDLFGEQAVLCGGLAALVKAGFQTLADNGWKPENAYLEVVYQLDLIVALIKKHGVTGMLSRISPAARFGSMLTGPKIVDGRTRRQMQEVLEEIRSGRFADRLDELDNDQLKRLNRSLLRLSDPRLEKAARKFRK